MTLNVYIWPWKCWPSSSPQLVHVHEKRSVDMRAAMRQAWARASHSQDANVCQDAGASIAEA